MSSWKTISSLILRSALGDSTIPYLYSSSDLESLLISSAYIVCSYVNFPIDYVVNVQTEDISPEPEKNLIFLMVLKAKSMILNSEYRIAAGKSLNIKDGPSAIDGRGVADNKKVLAEQATKDFDRAEFLYNANDSSKFQAIVGPFNIQYNSYYPYAGSRESYFDLI
jgi:hypothetical protein